MTIQLTQRDLEELKDGAQKFGRMMLRVNADNGVQVYLVCAQEGNHEPRRRGRRAADYKDTQGAGAGEATPAVAGTAPAVA